MSELVLMSNARLVDGLWRSWYQVVARPGRTGRVYSCAQVPEPVPLSVVFEHGPVRPVRFPSAPEVAYLSVALRAAGARAACSVGAALHRLMRYEGVTPLQLMAGRPGSWEASSMISWARFCGMSPVPVDGGVVDAIGHQVRVWVTDPCGHVELAGLIARTFQDVAAERGGWLRMSEGARGPGCDYAYGWLMRGSG